MGLILSSIELKSQTLDNPNTSPVHTLGAIEKDTLITIRSSSFNPEWVKDLKLLLPCENINLSKRSSRLPNAPRKYRNGTHRGIDFFANWGTNIRAVAPGVVIRADHHYNEYPPKFRDQLLQACGIVGHTPSDIFNNVLLGKAVFLDHGFNLVPGFRTISIYAHLSDIDKKISEVRKMYGQGGLPLGTTTQRQGGTVKSGVTLFKKGEDAKKFTDKTGFASKVDTVKGKDPKPEKRQIGRSAAKRRQMAASQMEEYTPYDIVLEYLLSSKQAATIEEANHIMIEMDAETIQSIVAE